MTMDRHRHAVLLLATALLLGITGDLLLRWIPWGVNVVLWVVLLCIASWRLAAGGWRENDEVRRPDPFIVVCVLLSAIGLMWRDSNVLATLDVLLLALFVPMLALNARGVRVQAAGLAELAGAVIVTGAHTLAGFGPLFAKDLEWNRVPRGSFRGMGVAARGTIIAAPALVVFGTLLASADPKFGEVLRELLVFDPAEAFLHVFMTVLIGGLAVGFLRSVTLGGPLPRPETPRLFSLPAPETNFALGLVNLLFALFVAVQFRYFFGAAPAELAQYARRGFFELAWVVGLVLPMLLLLEWLIVKDGGAKLFRALATGQVGLVFLMAASAFHRMKLYRDEYGLTRLRFFTTAFIVWLAVLLVWFVCTVLTGRRNRFAIGALASGMAIVVALHAINPDRVIIETNIAKARGGERPFDWNYALMMSDDAVPAILANADVVGQTVVYRHMRYRAEPDWRTWNWSRARAREASMRYESKATPPIGRR
jgi:Domain of unknown function (DUF4173)